MATAVENEVVENDEELEEVQEETAEPVAMIYYASEEEAKAAGSPGDKFKLLKVMRGEEVLSWAFGKYPDAVLVNYVKNKMDPSIKVVSAKSRKSKKSLSLDDCLAGINALPSDEEKLSALKKAGLDQLVLSFMGNGKSRKN